MGIPVSSIFGASTTITATSLVSLANGAAFALPGVQNSTSSEGAIVVRVYFRFTTGATPVANGTVLFYLLQGDSAIPTIYTDGVATTGGSFTPVTAQLVDMIQVTSTANAIYNGSFVIRNPGPFWGIGVLNNSGFAFNSTNSTTNFQVLYVTESIST
jgi:hypothetical protein